MSRSARYVLRRVAAAIAVVEPSLTTLASLGARWKSTPSWSIQSAKAVLSRLVPTQPLQTLQCPLPERISALRSACQEENAGTTENRLLMSSSTQTTAVWWQDP